MRDWLGHFTASGKDPPILSRICLYQKRVYMKNSQVVCWSLSRKEEKGKEKNTASSAQTWEWENKNPITDLERGQGFQDSLNVGEFPANASQ